MTWPLAIPVAPFGNHVGMVVGVCAEPEMAVTRELAVIHGIRPKGRQATVAVSDAQRHVARMTDHHAVWDRRAARKFPCDMSRPHRLVANGKMTVASGVRLIQPQPATTDQIAQDLLGEALGERLRHWPTARQLIVRVCVITSHTAPLRRCPRVFDCERRLALEAGHYEHSEAILTSSLSVHLLGYSLMTRGVATALLTSTADRRLEVSMNDPPVPVSAGSHDGAGGADHDKPYSFGNPRAVVYLLDWRQQVHLVILRGQVHDAQSGQGGLYSGDVPPALARLTASGVALPAWLGAVPVSDEEAAEIRAMSEATTQEPQVAPEQEEPNADTRQSP